MKALLDAQTDRILGFTMFGPEAGEVMAVVQTAMLAGMPYTGLRDAILAHPTMAEGLSALFSEVQRCCHHTFANVSTCLFSREFMQSTPPIVVDGQCESWQSGKRFWPGLACVGPTHLRRFVS